MRVDGYLGYVELDGSSVTVHKQLKGSSSVLLAHLTGITIERAGLGMRAIRISTASGSLPQVSAVTLGSHQRAAQDPYSLTFRARREPEFAAFRDAVYAAAQALA